MQAKSRTGKARSVPTLVQFQTYAAGLLNEYALTNAGKVLARGIKWSFEGDDYHVAWKALFTRARQLNLRYCKHLKRFYSPSPPKPILGDRVQLTSTGETGIVMGFKCFDILVTLDISRREAIVSQEYLINLPAQQPVIETHQS